MRNSTSYLKDVRCFPIAGKPEFVLQQIFFFVLFFFAFLFVKERVCFSDPAFMLFQMINTGDFYCPHSRWYLIVNQILPLVFIKLKLPIYWIALAFSFNYMLIPYLFSQISNLLSKSLIPGWITLFMLLGISQSFIYYPVNYFYIYLILFYFPLQYALERNNQSIVVIIALVSSLIILSGHKVYMIALLFMYTLILIEFKSKFLNTAKWLFPLIIVLSFIKIFFLTESTYDNQILSGIANSSKWKIWNSKFIRFFINDFLLTPGFILLLGIAVYLITKKISLKPTLLSIASFGAIFVISSIHLYYGASHTYSELYCNFSISFLAIPLLAIASGSKEINKYLVPVIVMVLIFGTLRSAAYDDLRERVDVLESIFEKADEEKWGDKILIPQSGEIRNSLVTEWALPYGSMLLSAMNGNAKTAYVDEGKENIDWNNRALFISTFEIIPNHNYFLNKDYFLLEEKVYHLMDHEQ